MYDHIEFHHGVPPEAALVHMAYYYTWAVGRGLHSPAASALPEFAAWRAGALSGSLFILNAFGGGLDEGCFNSTGRRFTEYYYADEEEGYGHFMRDYFLALGLQTADDFYRCAYCPQQQALLDTVFQTAFDNWSATLAATTP